ncbi:CopG protein [Caenispirillum salinarum AK4]|uniref:CopG protein n=1 Tax=Caenispirillum salinarum AK4 TaxID=1238182 RepID=K9HCG3_9PROT|nr:DUF411 domain-containing protein [Caenispirillum salinarum]EKV26461.1 CopG protein [Caenispirillum salinarum AK4]
MRKPAAILSAAGLALALGLGFSAAHAEPSQHGTMTVYKDPSCGCCGAWVDHARAAGFDVEVKDTDEMHVVKGMLGVPEQLGSCHTATIDGKVVEGHVPADTLARFLKEAPADARGIAVPGMPIGSPGMEQGGYTEPYDIVTFESDGDVEVYESRN